MKTGLFSSKKKDSSGVNLPEMNIKLLIPGNPGDVIYERDGYQNLNYLSGFEFIYILKKGGDVGDIVRANFIKRDLATNLLLHLDEDTMDATRINSMLTEDWSYDLVEGKFGKGLLKKHTAENYTVAIIVNEFIELAIIPQFTVEWWEKRSDNTLYDHAILNCLDYSYHGFNFGTNDKLGYCVHLYEKATGVTSLMLGDISPNEWTHFAVTKSYNTYKSYKNGVFQDFRNLGEIANGRKVSIMTGYQPGLVVDEIRISTTVRYTENFTPQTEPFTF